MNSAMRSASKMPVYVPTWVEFGWTPWGLGQDDEKPSVTEMFRNNDQGAWLSVCTACLEDFLQHNEVFKNGRTGRSCHMDSYMTIVDYGALQVACDHLCDHYQPSKQDWENVVTAWEGNPNTQPPAKIVAAWIRSKYLE